MSKLPVTFHTLDVVNEKHIRALQAFVVKEFGRIDVLVSNAGVMFDSGRSKVEGLIARRRKARAQGHRVLKKPVEVLSDKYAGRLKP
jgi:NAD(P)-dependent dehydrogenase (short-subunit alcohol dehydrogenase family)